MHLDERRVRPGGVERAWDPGTHWSHLEQIEGPGGVYRSYGRTYNKVG